MGATTETTAGLMMKVTCPGCGYAPGPDDEVDDGEYRCPTRPDRCRVETFLSPTEANARAVEQMKEQMSARSGL